eukprot:86091_1
MEPIFNAPTAPPLPKHSTNTTNNDLEDRNTNPMGIQSSRCSSVSSITSNSSNSNPPCTSTNSSVSLSAHASFADLSLSSGSLQNINLSNTLPQAQDATNKENVWATNADTDTTQRRSARISKKRKLGHVAYYTPKSWEAVYGPPKKKQKTTHRAPKALKPSVNELNKNSNTITNTSKPMTANQRLFKQNSKMKQMQNQLEKKKVQWLKHHYSAFEPFFSDKTKRRLRPKASSSSKSIDIARPKELEAQPETLQHGVLRDYQLHSVNWMRRLRHNGVPAILADEMGLGKTIQSIATIAAFLEDANDCNNRESPSLIICPLSVAEAWMSEFEKWMPHLKCVLFHGPKVQRENMMRDSIVFGKFDICVTTYEIATNNLGFLSKFCWNYFILDEAHRIKNEKTNWHHALKTIWSRCLFCVLLTGTPIQNNLHELWSLLSFMFGDAVFDDDSGAIFDSAYDQSSNTQDKKLLALVPYLLNPFFLRRLKSEVEVSLPPKEEIIIKLSMSHEQRKYYQTFLMAHASLIDEVSDTLYGGDRKRAKTQVSTWKKLRALYMNLRKIALHPFLLEDVGNDGYDGDELIAHSSKLQLLDKLLARLSAEGHRVLLFSCFTLVLDLLEVYCSYRGYRYLRLDGSTSRIRRKIDIMRFNDDPNSPFLIYLISNRAGGLGINLQSADTVIHFDTDWNPQADLQAQARAHRIGQKNMVKIYRLISKNTVEERILFRSQQKLYLDAVVNQGVNAVVNDDKFDLENSDLLGAIKFGAQRMFDKKSSSKNDEIDLDILLARSYNISDDHKEERHKLLEDLSAQNNVRDFNFSQKLKAGNEFEGKIYEKKAFQQVTAHSSSSSRKRGRSGRTAELIVDGLRFSTRIDRAPRSEFYTQCSQWIYDSRNTTPFAHEDDICWGCDAEFDCDDAVIECHSCPKTFHAKGACWQGERTRMGVFLCSQHHCFKCGAKTSECGMILRCLGCQLSFCYACSPDPHWKQNDDGLYFVDECVVAQHYSYALPKSSYMYILCGKQCKDFYDNNYSKRDLPDLSPSYDDLPLQITKHSSSSNRCKKKLSQITIDSRIRSYDMANNVMDRLRMNLTGDCQLICAFYSILYETEDDAAVKKEHFLECAEIKNELSNKLSLPQWTQCWQCKKWRICAVKLTKIGCKTIEKWQCAPSCSTFITVDTGALSKEELSILRLQRELMAAQLKKSSECEAIEKRMLRIIETHKLQNIDSIQTKDAFVCDARFNGIAQWNGITLPAADDDRLCSFYHHLLSQFRHWRVESLKTLCDLVGFVVVSKMLKKGSKKSKRKEFRVDQIALSYQKDKIINALAAFLICPSNEALLLTTQYFKQ